MLRLLLAIILTVSHGTVIEQLYEGYSQHNDLYVIEVQGQEYEVCSDDLDPGDEITVYFWNKYPVWVLYGWR